MPIALFFFIATSCLLPPAAFFLAKRFSRPWLRNIAITLNGIAAFFVAAKVSFANDLYDLILLLILLFLLFYALFQLASKWKNVLQFFAVIGGLNLLLFVGVTPWAQFGFSGVDQVFLHEKFKLQELDFRYGMLDSGSRIHISKLFGPGQLFEHYVGTCDNPTTNYSSQQAYSFVLHEFSTNLIVTYEENGEVRSDTLEIKR